MQTVSVSAVSAGKTRDYSTVLLAHAKDICEEYDLEASLNLGGFYTDLDTGRTASLMAHFMDATLVHQTTRRAALNVVCKVETGTLVEVA